MTHSNPLGPQALCASEICVITPTKGRHPQLRELLRTLSEQTTPVGHIIIADGGRDAQDLVNSYQDRLAVLWLDCPRAGQVIQRNAALHLVPDECKVIIYFDDDIQLTPGAVEAFVSFWNTKSHVHPPAGVSFNLTNMPAQPDSLFRRIFCMGTSPKGKVLRSGYNTPVVNADVDIKSQWLIGGATGWRKDILMKQLNEEIPSRWAITEDLMFSYPIAKSGEHLFVCATARAAHIDNTPIESLQMGVFRGNAAVLWRYFFVHAHPELSKAQFYWMTLGQILGRLVQAALGRPVALGYALGYLKGLLSCLKSQVLGRDIRGYLR